MGWTPKTIRELLTTKGDLGVHDGSDADRLPVGSDGQVLTADSAESLGVKWAASSGGGSSNVVVATAIGDGSADRTTTSTSPVDLDDMSVSIAAAEGDILEIIFNCNHNQSASNKANSFEAAVAGTRINPLVLDVISDANFTQVVTLVAFHTVAAGDISGGNVAVKIQWSVNSGTGTVLNKSGDPGARRPVLIVKNYGS